MISLNKTSLGLLNDTATYATNQKVQEKQNLVKLNLKEIIGVNFPDTQYHKEQTTKNQIVLHHTVSGVGTKNDIAYWLSTADRIATALIIGWDGKIYQCFSSKYWGSHLGIKAANNTVLNQGSIGIEIDAWGGLIQKGKSWYPAKWDENLKKNIPNVSVKPIKNVVLFPNGFRGFYGFEKYTDEQIESVRKLLIYFNGVYNIPLDYNNDMWNLSQKALSGKPGIWTHVSYRVDKSDCYPDERMITMIKLLK
jgi:N-acetyl-anhydromuramyl-L-alanine amidase AmpD